MDPLTQGALGASLPQALSTPKVLRDASIIGFLAGMTPDLDILIQSKTDALLFLEYHRQFTHSLIFIPVGGLLSALALFWFFRKRLSFLKVFIFASLGYATHGVLDACTTYGTQLFWPFTNTRVAWNFISIIDPLFTLPLLAFVLVAFKKRSLKIARFGMMWALGYMFLGFLMHNWAVSEARHLAKSRGHEYVKIDAKPSFANIILWKSIYDTGDVFYVDAIRLGFPVKVFNGDKALKLNLERDFPTLPRESQQSRDIERFSWFSSGYVAVHPTRKNVIGDIRYSIVPNKIDPMWGIVIDLENHQDFVKFENFRDLNSRGEFFKMLGF